MDHFFIPFTKTSSCCFLSLLALVFSMQLLMLSQASLSFSFIGNNNNSSLPNCIHHEKLALLQLKHGFLIRRGYYNYSSRLDSWNPAIDCCSWEGITCDEGTSHVIEIDLRSIEAGSSWVEGRIDSSLFHLRNLQKLDLSYNSFYPHPIPSGLGHLTNLTHLNLSYSVFTGQIPLEISRLTKLVSLDLSCNNLKLKNPNLTTLIGNLSSLQELFLERVNISGEHGGKWARAISIAMPNLQRLSLRGCGLQGPIDPSLFQIPNLSQVSLDENNLSTVVPDFLGVSSALTSLTLRYCDLYGEFPQSIFLLSNLQKLDVSYNPHLTIDFSKFPQNKALQYLNLDGINIVEKLLDSFSNLKFLKVLSLRNCDFSDLSPSLIANLTQLEYLDLSSNNFDGMLPSSISNLAQLEYLDLSSNNFSGMVPSSISNLTQLEYLGLSSNNFGGMIPSSISNLTQLRNLDLSSNNFSGTIPLSLFTHPALQRLYLSYNQFSGYLPDSHNEYSSSLLKEIRLNNNKLQGTIPRLFFEVTKLRYLFLSNNNFNEFPNILQSFNQLEYLDLSKNKIHGEIPAWIWEVGNGSLYHLNLSNNFFESFEHPLPQFSSSNLGILDLHSNRLQGSLPILPHQVYFHDYSNNSLSSISPASINFTSTRYLFFSGNKVSGEISLSICKAHFLEVLDLSRNNFSGKIPTCLGKIGNSFKILNLQRNAFQGNVPDTFKKECSLRTLNLDNNELEGPIPKSLAVIDLANNHLNDSFPFWFGGLSNLRILILRSNKFHGSIAHSHDKNSSFQFLQIFDISSNSFVGIVPPNFFLNWKLMTGEGGSNSSSNIQVVKYQINVENGIYYQDSVTVRMKGLDLEVVKIITALTSVDLSNNRFEGEIPKSICNLKLLHVLNFSQNDFTGPISSLLENLTQLESLDLSRNNLLGNIPWQLTKLTFLAVLDLSQNLLHGRIPQSQQFLTFTNSSFLGNIGLCGLPLSTKCEDTVAVPPSTFSSFGLDGVGEIDLEFMWMGFGIGVVFGFGVIFWTLALWRRGSRKYIQLIDRMFVHNFSIIPSYVHW